MKMKNSARREPIRKVALAGLSVCAAQLTSAADVTIATFNSPAMLELKKLSASFENANRDIRLNWVILEENVLRQRATTDITTNSGQFDVVAIGTYETPQWGRRGWLMPMTNLPVDYDLDDVVKTARDGLSYDGQLYALPFYVESSMTFYRKDLFQAAGLNMPDQPTYDQIKQFAVTLTDKAKGQYGICLRGKAGWGENMAYVSTVVNTYGGRWFDENWKAQVDTPEWHKAISFYADLLKNEGPPGASSNGFNENLTLMSSGKCAMWIDSTAAAGTLYNKSQSKVADKIGFAAAPVAVTPKGSHWLWSWSLAIPKTSKSQDAAKKFVTWATSKQYTEMVGKDEGWGSVPPGRKSTFARPEYRQAAPFGEFVLRAIESADPNDSSLRKVPYSGIQFVGIPEFPSFGTAVGQAIAGVVAGQTSVDAALKAGNAAADRAVKQAGYQK
ncbi:sugar ABC transporter substrate-binding protein [Paraburkholderia sp. RL18-101-BIB-B]|uniref:ABC transporter substrate-binding protein n=1 Tax=Paraburkholderia sp. RL18-101-BIB-B TaxID=3031634 RepID=UPI0038B6CD48